MVYLSYNLAQDVSTVKMAYVLSNMYSSFVVFVWQFDFQN